MRKLKIFFIALCILTVGILGFNLWVYAKSSGVRNTSIICDVEDVGGTALWYRVVPVEEEPEKYWNLTDPDEYILLAINNPGKYIRIAPENQSKTTFHRDFPTGTHGLDHLRYEDAYYAVDIIDTDDFGLPDRIPQISALALAPAWTVFGLTAVHKHFNKKE